MLQATCAVDALVVASEGALEVGEDPVGCALGGSVAMVLAEGVGELKPWAPPAAEARGGLLHAGGERLGGGEPTLQQGGDGWPGG